VNLIYENIKNAGAYGPTPLMRHIRAAAEELHRSGRTKKCLLVLTDGAEFEPMHPHDVRKEIPAMFDKEMPGIALNGVLFGPDGAFNRKKAAGFTARVPIGPEYLKRMLDGTQENERRALEDFKVVRGLQTPSYFAQADKAGDLAGKLEEALRSERRFHIER